jgi:hypothetical protein
MRVPALSLALVALLLVVAPLHWASAQNEEADEAQPSGGDAAGNARGATDESKAPREAAAGDAELELLDYESNFASPDAEAAEAGGLLRLRWLHAFRPIFPPAHSPRLLPSFPPLQP